MKYLFLLIGDERAWDGATEEERAAAYAAHGSLDAALRAAGKAVEGYELAASTAATQVRFGDGGPLVVDGPFAETREQIGGYYVFDCADLDEALEWARRMPMDGGDVVEVRPIIEHDG